MATSKPIDFHAHRIISLAEISIFS